MPSAPAGMPVSAARRANPAAVNAPGPRPHPEEHREHPAQTQAPGQSQDPRRARTGLVHPAPPISERPTSPSRSKDHLKDDGDKDQPGKDPEGQKQPGHRLRNPCSALPRGRKSRQCDDNHDEAHEQTKHCSPQLANPTRAAAHRRGRAVPRTHPGLPTAPSARCIQVPSPARHSQPHSQNGQSLAHLPFRRGSVPLLRENGF